MHTKLITVSGVCCVSLLRVYTCVSCSISIWVHYMYVRMPSSPGSIAGVPSSQVLPGYLITAPPSVFVAPVRGALAVWIPIFFNLFLTSARFILSYFHIMTGLHKYTETLIHTHRHTYEDTHPKTRTKTRRTQINARTYKSRQCITKHWHLQTRTYTHTLTICEFLWLQSQKVGWISVATGIRHTLTHTMCMHPLSLAFSPLSHLYRWSANMTAVMDASGPQDFCNVFLPVWQRYGPCKPRWVNGWQSQQQWRWSARHTQGPETRWRQTRTRSGATGGGSDSPHALGWHGGRGETTLVRVNEGRRRPQRVDIFEFCQLFFSLGFVLTPQKSCHKTWPRQCF